jgi:hypothetical protein
MNPFTGPEWEGWEVKSDYVNKGDWEIYSECSLFRDWGLIGKFPTPEAARQVVNLIEAAEAGKPIPTLKDVAELVEALANLTYGGVDDFGGSYVNLQVDREDIAAARSILEKSKEKYGL